MQRTGPISTRRDSPAQPNALGPSSLISSIIAARIRRYPDRFHVADELRGGRDSVLFTRWGNASILLSMSVSNVSYPSRSAAPPSGINACFKVASQKRAMMGDN